MEKSERVIILLAKLQQVWKRTGSTLYLDSNFKFQRKITFPTLSYSRSNIIMSCELQQEHEAFFVNVYFVNKEENNAKQNKPIPKCS